MKCKKCKHHMTKTYAHHNPTYHKGQWEHVGYYCKRCKKFQEK